MCCQFQESNMCGIFLSLDHHTIILQLTLAFVFTITEQWRRKSFLDNGVRRNEVCLFDDQRFAAQKKHVTLIRKPVKLDETGFSVADASGFSQKFNNGRVFIEVDIISKNRRLLWLVNKPFLLFVCFV